MPGRDGTGPFGMGPMTGRRAGYCAGLRSPGYSFLGRGLGFGLGRGNGPMLWAAGLIPGRAYLAYRWTKRSRIK